MDIALIHVFNALLYASVLFLIAGGLSLIYGVMRIVNLAHGNLYAFGAYVSAWIIGYLSTSVAAGEAGSGAPTWVLRSEEHTSELQSRPHLVCRLLLEKKK